MYIEQVVSKLKDDFLNHQRRTDQNIYVLLKMIKELQVEVKELKSGR